jgi:hypothetical protein
VRKLRHPPRLMQERGNFPPVPEVPPLHVMGRRGGEGRAMTGTRRRTSPEDARRIASHARENQPCEDCGAAPGEPCILPGSGRTVCKGRYIAAAIAIRQQDRAARRTPEQQAQLDAVLARLPRISREEVEAGRSPAGGFTRAQLAAWQVPWPPPAGWLRTLLGEEDGPR